MTQETLIANTDSLTAYKETLTQPLRQVTLVFLIKDDQVLLALKKRGFGKNRWNGTGGKPKPGETLEQAAIRETQEEIKVTPKSLTGVATLDFYFPQVPINQDFNQQVCVFLCEDWDGEPQESEEMKPAWFSKDQLPFSQMWPDDPHWLPHVLARETLTAEFMFDSQEQIAAYNIKVGKY